jgi:hypothetical protein
MRSLKKEKYSNGLESGRWYKCYQDYQWWLFRIYKYDEVENFIYVHGITYTLDGDDIIEDDFSPHFVGIDGVKYGRWGTLRTTNIRKITFRELKLIMEKNSGCDFSGLI